MTSPFFGEFMGTLVLILLGDGVVTLQVIAHHLHVDGSRQTKVQNLRHDVGRKESEHHARKLLRQRKAKPVDIVPGRMVLRGQGHQYICI